MEKITKVDSLYFEQVEILKIETQLDNDCLNEVSGEHLKNEILKAKKRMIRNGIKVAAIWKNINDNSISIWLDWIYEIAATKELDGTKSKYVCIGNIRIL